MTRPQIIRLINLLQFFLINTTDIAQDMHQSCFFRIVTVGACNYLNTRKFMSLNRETSNFILCQLKFKRDTLETPFPATYLLKTADTFFIDINQSGKLGYRVIQTLYLLRDQFKTKGWLIICDQNIVTTEYQTPDRWDR